MTITIHIKSGEVPNATVKRVHGTRNFGLYCSECKEFFAVAVRKPNEPELDIKFESDGPVCFQCPFCQKIQMRQTSEIASLILTEALKRKPKPPSDFH